VLVKSPRYTLRVDTARVASRTPWIARTQQRATRSRVQIHRTRAGAGNINIVYFVNTEYTSRCFNAALALLASRETRSRGRCRNSRAIFLRAQPRSPFQRPHARGVCARVCRQFIGPRVTRYFPAVKFNWKNIATRPLRRARPRKGFSLSSLVLS